jgi:TPR repeat protein
VRKSGRIIAIVLALIATDTVSASPRHRVSGYAESPYSAAARIKRSAERGDARAQAELGWIYSIGRGVPQNYHQAAKWYYRAAEQGQDSAQFALGLLYNKGQGVPKDLIQAHMWLNLSASQDVGENRDFKVRIRDSIASKMTPDQVEEAQHLANTWYKAQ